MQNRQTAYKVSISDILNGTFVKEEGWEPSYVLINGLQVSRVNLICVIVSKEFNETFQNLVVDDGTGKISVRSFDQKMNFNYLNIGDVILLIAKIREYNKERYLAPEIIRKVENKKWIEVRKLELKKLVKSNNFIKNEEINKAEEKEVDDERESIFDKIISVIKNLDKGDGANFEDVVKQVKNEQIIYELLKQGEIFEFKPGKLKVLE